MTRIKLAYVHEYTDRLGKRRRYVRVPGKRQVKLPGLPGSAEFMDAYRDALSSAHIAVHGGGDSLGGLVKRFYGSAEYQNLKPSSRRLYRLALDPVAIADGHRMVKDLPVEKARKIIEEIGATRPGMANLTRSVLMRVFAYAISINVRSDNPFLSVPLYKLGTHHTWTDAQIETFERKWPVGTRQRLAFDVLLYTMQRISDAVKLKRPKSRRDAFRFVQQKTGAELLISIHPDLWRSIVETDARGIYLLGDRTGRPMTSNALGKMMAAAITDAELLAECVAHGLRKAGMRRLAEAGSTAHQIGAVSGHKSLKEIERYTAKVDQARLAKEAINNLPNRKRSRTG